MVSTFTVVAASMMLGQAPTLPAAGQPAAPTEYIYSGGVLVPITDAQRAALGERKPEASNTPVLSWFKGLFKRGDDAPPHIIGGKAPAKANENAAMPPAENFPPALEKSKMPAASEAPASDAPKAVAKPATVSNVAFTPTAGASGPILASNVNRIGRDEKFEWVTGQLEIEKGHFILYYATPDTVDPHHGRIQINPQKVDMRRFQNGDLVSVRGQLSRGATPVYQLTSADLIERAKQ